MTRHLPDAGASPLQGPSALLGSALPAVLTDCRHEVGAIARIERAIGGNVSHVFRVHGSRGSVILKVRADRFARIPTLRTDPALIADERRALAIYAQRAPSVFPRVIAFHAAAHAMILTDVFPDHRTYHQHLDERPATVEEVTRLGSTLRRVHDVTQDVRTDIRSQGDVWFREHTFDFCLRAAGHSALSQACLDMAALPDQQLILGDLAPKNFSLAAGGVAICDLDNVHRGWPGYDLAYVLAHLLIHHLQWPGNVGVLSTALLAGYLGAPQGPGTRIDDKLIATVAAGVILYRLANETVPYPLTGPPALAQQCHGQVRRLLDSDAVTMRDLVQAAGAST